MAHYVCTLFKNGIDPSDDCNLMLCLEGRYRGMMISFSFAVV